MTVSIPLPGGLGDSQAVLEEARGRTRRRRRRLAITGATIAALALGGSLYATVSNSGGSPANDPASAPIPSSHVATAPVARLVDSQVVVPRLPSGLALVFDAHGNNASAPYSYGETIEYASAKPVSSTNVPAQLLTVSVNEETRAFSYQPASCSPAASCPISPLAIDGKPARVIELGHFRFLAGRTVVWWHPSPNVVLTVTGQGLGQSAVEHFAEQLRLAPATTSCVAGGVARHSGICAPNLEEASPPNSLSARQATTLATGSVARHRWTLYGAISSDDRRSWIEIGYEGATATLLEDVPVTDSETATARNGASFLFGMVPAATTRIVMPNGVGTFSIRPSAVLRGWRFFASPESASVTKDCKVLNRVTRPNPQGPSLLKATTIRYFDGTHLLGQLSACNTGAEFQS